MTEPDLSALIIQLSKLVDTLGTSETARVENDKTRADAEKTRADAAKAQAEADKVTAETSTARASVQYDLEAKDIANQSARSALRAAQVDKLIAQTTGAVPDVSSVTKNTVTLSEGKVLREGEAVSLALQLVAGEVAGSIGGTTNVTDLFVVSNPNLLSDVVAYRRLAAEATAMSDAMSQAKEDATAVLRALGPPLRGLGAVGTAVVLGSLAGAVGQQVLSLFEVDTAATTHDGAVPALSAHVAVMARLITHDSAKAWKLHHEFARVPPASSVLLERVTALIRPDLELAQLDARLQDAATMLGDPAADLAAAQKRLKDPSADEQERRYAQAAADAASARAGQLAGVTSARAAISGVLSRVRAFADRVVAAPQDGAPNALATAMAIEPIAIGTGSHEPHVLVLGPGTVASNQLIVSRRIFRARIQVSVALALDYVLLRGDRVLAAGSARKAVAYTGIVKGDGVTWNRATAITAAYAS